MKLKGYFNDDRMTENLTRYGSITSDSGDEYEIYVTRRQMIKKYRHKNKITKSIYT